jgi:hypothetical protein
MSDELHTPLHNGTKKEEVCVYMCVYIYMCVRVALCQSFR